MNLQVVNNGPYIKAPEFCEYKEDGVVHANICNICKRCSFISIVKELAWELSKEDQSKCILYLMEVNHKLAKVIRSQIQLLQKQGRLVLAFFINPAVAEQMFSYCFAGDIIRSRKVLTEYLKQEASLFLIQGCPVYISRKLTLASIQVVGEVVWS